MKSLPCLPALSLPLTLLLSACAGSTDAPPNLPESYREPLTEAWQAAGRGENPTRACAIVTGLAVGRGQQASGQIADATRAYQLCYVDIPARYIETRLANAGGDADSVCMSISTFLITLRMSLGSFADDLATDRAALDARLKEHIADGVRRSCGAMAQSLLDM